MASKAEKLGDFGEEEQELDLEEDNFKPRITDLLENNHYFKEVIKFLFIYFCLFMLRERNVVLGSKLTGRQKKPQTTSVD